MFDRIIRWLTTWVAEDPNSTYSNLDRADPDINFSQAVTQYYWDVKQGLAQERDVLAVQCPACNAGRYQACHEVRCEDATDDGTHWQRHDFLVDVHVEFAMMDGRNVA